MALTLKIFTRAEGAARFMGQHELEGARVTIGRSVECTLQLPDPERKLSRVHVEFLGTRDGYRMRVASTQSSVVVNGREYPPGSEVTLRAGDALVMDVYDLDIVNVGTPVRETADVVVARAPAPEVSIVEPAAHPAAFGRPAGAGARLAKRLGIGAAAIAGVMLLLAFWPHTAGRIEDLAYMVKPGGRVDFKGTYEGEPFALVRTSAKDGAGTSVLYLGTKPERLRATFSGHKRLTEILAIDKGHRFTLNAVDGKRMEYRLYGPDRSFWSGSVLYRAKGRWLHGLLKAEAFAGYEALVDVTDFTEAIARAKLSSLDSAGGGAFAMWKFSLISPARAQDDEPRDLTREDFNKVVEEQAGHAAKVAWEAKQEHEKLEADVRDAAGGFKNPFGYITDGIRNYVKSKLDKSLTVELFDKFKTPVSIVQTVQHVSDNYNFDEPGASANAGGGTWKPMEGTSVGNGIDVALGYFRKARDFIAWGPRPTIDPLDLASSTSVELSAPDTSAQDRGTRIQKRTLFEAAADKVGSCILAKNFACAEAAVAEMQKNASHETPHEALTDAELISDITDSLSRAKTEVADAARSSDEAARQSLLAQDRQTAEAAAAAAKNIARREAERRANVPPPRPSLARQEPVQDNTVLDAEERRRLEAEYRVLMLGNQSVREANEEAQRGRRFGLNFTNMARDALNPAETLARLSQEEKRSNAQLEATSRRLETARTTAAAAPSGNCGGYGPLLGSVGKPGDIQCTVQLQNAEGLRQQAIKNCQLGDKKSADIIYNDRYKKIIEFVKSQCR